MAQAMITSSVSAQADAVSRPCYTLFARSMIGGLSSREW
jgi:hypothetical protein